MRICTLTLRVLTLDDKTVKNLKNRVDSHGASYRILETVRRQNAGGPYTVAVSSQFHFFMHPVTRYSVRPGYKEKCRRMEDSYDDSKRSFQYHRDQRAHASLL